MIARPQWVNHKVLIKCKNIITVTKGNQFGEIHHNMDGIFQLLDYKIKFESWEWVIKFKGLSWTADSSKRYSIRSNEERVLKVPKFKHDTFGKRAFAVYGPLAWNCLPKEIRLCDEIEEFKRNLKTHLFVKFVNESTLAIWFWRIIVKRPRMLSAQFVALYKPCKPKPRENFWTYLNSLQRHHNESNGI